MGRALVRSAGRRTFGACKTDLAAPRFDRPRLGSQIAPVALARPLMGPDGIRLDRPGRAIVVEEGAGAVSKIDLTTDHWSD